MRKTSTVTLAGVLFLGALTSCKHAPPVALPDCSPASAPTVVQAAAQVSVVDNGATVCLPVGLVLGVTLSVPPKLAARGWARIEVSDPAVLQVRANPGALAVAGTVTGLFLGKKRGVATVASFLPPCRGPAASCPIEQRWTVTVIVGGAPTSPR